MVRIYHNPKCSKSRHALDVLKEQGFDVDVIEYLKNPPSIEVLTDLVKHLGIKPHDLVRTKDPIYIEKFKGKTFTDQKWLQILHEYPVLIERPIIVKNGKAVIGRSEESLKIMLS